MFKTSSKQPLQKRGKHFFAKKYPYTFHLSLEAVK